MRFKMAENSLFAILLRSRWWYSVLIGLVLVGLCIAITSAQYLVLSFTVGLPFFAIGGFGAYKQLQQPSQKSVLAVTEEARQMSASAVAQKIADHYTKQGYSATAVKGSGSELVLTLNNQKLLLNAKRFKAANTGIEPLKSLVSAGEKIDATGYLYVSLGDVTETAIDYANNNRIEILQADRLVGLINTKK